MCLICLFAHLSLNGTLSIKTCVTCKSVIRRSSRESCKASCIETPIECSRSYNSLLFASIQHHHGHWFSAHRTLSKGTFYNFETDFIDTNADMDAIALILLQLKIDLILFIESITIFKRSIFPWVNIAKLFTPTTCALICHLLRCPSCTSIAIMAISTHAKQYVITTLDSIDAPN